MRMKNKSNFDRLFSIKKSLKNVNFFVVRREKSKSMVSFYQNYNYLLFHMNKMKFDYTIISFFRVRRVEGKKSKLY